MQVTSGGTQVVGVFKFANPITENCISGGDCDVAGYAGDGIMWNGTEWENIGVVGTHTHLEHEITDLDKYTKAEVDAIVALLDARITALEP